MLPRAPHRRRISLKAVLPAGAMGRQIPVTSFSVIRPSATAGHSGAVRPQITACSPPHENCAPTPSEDCAPKKLTGLVQLECYSRPETPNIVVITPEFASKNCFFIDFAINTVCFCGFTPKFMKISVYFGIKTVSLFFWSSPQNS